jgi:chromosomal replication initiation ATPase DnaA
MFQRAQGRVLVDDADQGRDEEDLIRLFDLARSHGGAVLFVALDGPRPWLPRVPDLRSRLAAAPRGLLHEPDPRLLEVVLRRLCRDRFLELSDEAVAYLVARMERSFAAARRLVDALDAGLPRGGRHPIKVATVRRVVGDMVTGLGAYADDEGDGAL